MAEQTKDDSGGLLGGFNFGNVLSGEGKLKTDVNINLNTEVYFYLGVTIVISLLVGAILATIGKDLIKK